MSAGKMPGKWQIHVAMARATSVPNVSATQSDPAKPKRADADQGRAPVLAAAEGGTPPAEADTF